MRNLGELYARKENYDLAIEYYEQAIQMADTLRFETLKLPAYISLLNLYIEMKEPRKSLDFLNSKVGDELKEYFTRVGASTIADQAYAIIYSEMGELDSASIYFNRSRSIVGSSDNLQFQVNSYWQEAKFFRRKGDYKQALDLLIKADELAHQVGELEAIMGINQLLDTVYNLAGDVQRSKVHAAVYFQYKDSIQKINKEKDLVQVEAHDEQLRQIKLAEEEAERKRQRNNIQYLAITIGIATLFFAMVLFGMFRVSARTIRMVGFFAFLMFFEFIFLIFKKIYTVSLMGSHGRIWLL